MKLNKELIISLLIGLVFATCILGLIKFSVVFASYFFTALIFVLVFGYIIYSILDEKKQQQREKEFYRNLYK